MFPSRLEAESARRKERALEGLGVGYGGSWGSDCPESKSGLVLGVLANDWTCPFPHLQRAEGINRTRLFREWKYEMPNEVE